MNESKNSISVYNLINHLQNLSRFQLAEELSTLEAIFGGDSLFCELDKIQINDSHSLNSSDSLSINLKLNLNLGNEDISNDEDLNFFLTIFIPNDYPQNSLPRFEISSKYIGPFKVDNFYLSKLIQTKFQGQEVGECLLYDGIETIKEFIMKFYMDKLKERDNLESNQVDSIKLNQVSTLCPINQSLKIVEEVSIHKTDFTVFVSQPIIDRKSIFIGHAVILNNPKDVPKILNQLLSDKKISRASHNIVAWRCEFNGCLHQDNDDDGETAAGSRMQHLLHLLNVQNVFVCVSRWFGGIHLGADRFKHINQVTRDALVISGLVQPSSSNQKSSPSDSQVNSKSIAKKKR
ncbi:hypothetical protein O181_033874 [Austropuccinia psidii MF-1]|uniref:RWD domain-containing protein n=1 Tax=Austropuccinia psidii MF-1 TaxID=1389203 RepID=A0A9Q3CZL2_9BASI|nr:hypothetical protein [Austropuccinia psidii MF-1]